APWRSGNSKAGGPGRPSRLDVDVRVVSDHPECSREPGISASALTESAKPGPNALDGLAIFRPGYGSTLSRAVRRSTSGTASSLQAPMVMPLTVSAGDNKRRSAMIRPSAWRTAFDLVSAVASSKAVPVVNAGTPNGSVLLPALTTNKIPNR